MKIEFVVYRNKETKRIERYSSHKKNEKSKEMIDKYNSNSFLTHSAEIVSDLDLISVLEIAEKSKRIKDIDLREIEASIDQLSNEFFALRASLT